MNDSQKIKIVSKYLGVDGWSNDNLSVVENPNSEYFGMVHDERYNDYVDVLDSEKEGYEKVKLSSGFSNRKNEYFYCKMI